VAPAMKSAVSNCVSVQSLRILHLDRRTTVKVGYFRLEVTFGRQIGDGRSPRRPPRYQCLIFQCQVIASAASSSRVTISSGSKAIGPHARLTLAVSQHTHAPRMPNSRIP
jgi:hypothetical protein